MALFRGANNPRSGYTRIEMGSKILVKAPQQIKRIKNELEKAAVFDRRRRISTANGTACLFSTGSAAEMSALLGEYDAIEILEDTELPPLEGLAGAVAEVAGSREDLLANLPRKWSLYPPMVLFLGDAFGSPAWAGYFEEKGRSRLFEHLLRSFFAGFTHFAVNRPIIESDVMRRPFNLVPLYGDFGPAPDERRYENPTATDFKEAFWCTANQNAISQEWAPRYTMFSRGNITEKKRVLGFEVQGKNVVDLYAGIGYFAFSYLAKGAVVFCWEINPWSIEGLLRGLVKNGCKHRLVRSDEIFSVETYTEEISKGTRAFVFHESNEMAPTRLRNLDITISHFNLGLLPLLRQGWQVVTAVGCENAILHVHENVHKKDFDRLKEELASYFGGNVQHLEKVKTFAPDVWHVVVDVTVKA